MVYDRWHYRACVLWAALVDVLSTVAATVCWTPAEVVAVVRVVIGTVAIPPCAICPATACIKFRKKSGVGAEPHGNIPAPFPLVLPINDTEFRNVVNIHVYISFVIFQKVSSKDTCQHCYYYCFHQSDFVRFRKKLPCYYQDWLPSILLRCSASRTLPRKNDFNILIQYVHFVSHTWLNNHKITKLRLRRFLRSLLFRRLRWRCTTIRFLRLIIILGCNFDRSRSYNDIRRLLRICWFGGFFVTIIIICIATM